MGPGKESAVLIAKIIGEPARLAVMSGFRYVVEDRALLFQTVFTCEKYGGAVFAEAVVAIECRTVAVAAGHVLVEGIVGKLYLILFPTAALDNGFHIDFFFLCRGLERQYFILPEQF